MVVNKIMAFLDACIKIFDSILMKLKNVPRIIHNTLKELNDAKVVMEEALQLMQQKDTSDGTITQINYKLTICEIWAQRLSLTATRAQETMKDRQFPDHLIPELDKQRGELGDSVVLLSSDLRVLNLRKLGKEILHLAYVSADGQHKTWGLLKPPTNNPRYPRQV